MTAPLRRAKGVTWGRDLRIPGLLYVVLAGGFLTVMMLGGTMAPGYLIGDSAISDLGVIRETADLFKGSLVVVGVLQAAASILYFGVHRRRLILGVSLVAAFGATGVGLVPLDRGGLHSVFALLAFLAFNLQAIVTAPVVRYPLRALSWLAGVIGLAFLVVMVIGDTGDAAALGPIGHGGVERMIVYPALLWLMALGGYLMASDTTGSPR
jgi:hypothetical membrane protein